MKEKSRVLEARTYEVVPEKHLRNHSFSGFHTLILTFSNLTGI